MGSGPQKDPPGKGWFEMPGQQIGDRTLAEQMTGLAPLLPLAAGATVLDLGCAEGLISLELMRAGAAKVHGLESVAGRVETARRIFAGRDAEFFEADLERFATEPPTGLLRRYGVVLVLSIAQKMQRPTEFLTAAANRAAGIVAIRLPKPIIDDRRSGHVKVDVPYLMAHLGLSTIHTAPGPRGEWVGIFERVGL